MSMMPIEMNVGWPRVTNGSFMPTENRVRNAMTDKPASNGHTRMRIAGPEGILRRRRRTIQTRAYGIEMAMDKPHSAAIVSCPYAMIGDKGFITRVPV